MSIAAIIRGFTDGYATGTSMKERKEDREQQKKDRELAAQDRETKRTEQQAKKDYARQIASNVGTIGQPKAMQQTSEDGIAATLPGVYSRKDEIQDRARLAGQIGDVDEVKAARAELGSLYNEGVGQALMAFRNQGPEAAIKVYNEFGIDRLDNKYDKLEKGYRLYRQDGTSFEVDPEQMEMSQLDLLKRAQLMTEQAKARSYEALSKQRGMAKLGTGQVLIDPDTGERVAEGPARPAPVGRGGGGSPRVDNSARFRAETIRKLIAQNDKVIGSFMETPERKKVAAEDNARLNGELMNTLIDGGAPAQAAPEVGPSGTIPPKQGVIPPPGSTIRRIDPKTLKFID